MQWPILWVFRTTSHELICSTKSLGAEWDVLCSSACRSFIPFFFFFSFLSLSRHTGRPNSPVSSWYKHLIAANLLDLKIQIWISVCIWVDKMGERGLGGGVEMMGWMTACLDIYKKKKKTVVSLMLSMRAEYQKSSGNHFFFFFWANT